MVCISVLSNEANLISVSKVSNLNVPRIMVVHIVKIVRIDFAGKVCKGVQHCRSAIKL